MPRDREYYIRMMQRDPRAIIGVGVATAAVYAARHGACGPRELVSTAGQQITRRLRSKYGDRLTVATVLQLMRLEDQDPQDPGYLRCQFCGVSSPEADWGHDRCTCPNCRRRYDYVLAQDSRRHPW